jgi:hypothetical protein
VASVIGICNLALSHFGDRAEVSSIDPPDGSAQADHCARYYPIARDETLERHAWRFATRREVLAEVTNPLTSWTYAYALPNQCVRPLAVYLPGNTDDQVSQPFTVEVDDTGADVLYTNAGQATLRFIWRQEDPEKFSPLFVVALSRLLAAYVAGPITKDERRAAAQLKFYEDVALPRAIAADAMGQQNDPYRDAHTPAFLAVRNS